MHFCLGSNWPSKMFSPNPHLWKLFELILSVADLKLMNIPMPNLLASWQKYLSTFLSMPLFYSCLYYTLVLSAALFNSNNYLLFKNRAHFAGRSCSLGGNTEDRWIFGLNSAYIPVGRESLCPSFREGVPFSQLALMNESVCTVGQSAMGGKALQLHDK